MNAFLQPFNVLILYDTVHAATSAMATYQRLSQQLTNKYLFKLKLWRADMLDLPRQVRWATKEATEADMVIVAWDRSPTALEALKNWAWQWPVSPADSTRRALVALYTGVGIENDSDSFDSCIGAFQALAERTGMDLITQNDELAGRSPARSATDLEPAAASLLMKSSIPVREFAFAEAVVPIRGVPHWGINE